MSKITQLQKDICLIELNLSGITNIEFSYSGGGDDGAIDDINYLNMDGDTIIINKEISENIINILEDTADDLLCQITDWWNNDGGYGELTLNTIDGDYKIKNNVGNMTYSAEFYEGSFLTNKPPKYL